MDTYTPLKKLTENESKQNSTGKDNIRRNQILRNPELSYYQHRKIPLYYKQNPLQRKILASTWLNKQ